jgi:adenylosuccinate synthase
VGLQWGDEAKGKIVDLLTPGHEVVVRYQGGANAGHTVVKGGQKYKLSLLPSGILSPGVKCVVTGGVVINPVRILEEIDELAQRGVPVGDNLMLSDRAHVIFPWHMEEERSFDLGGNGAESIGTTMRGIGPCYADKVGRIHGVRLGDLYRESFRGRIEKITADKNVVLCARIGNGFTSLNAQEIHDQYRRYAERLRPFVGDTTEFLLAGLESGKKVLFEGAQGSLLDVDHGTYPFVTSSNASGAGVSSGSGVPGKYLQRIVGVVKAYSTRVGGGPFPTEQNNETGQHIRDRGQEYGTVTRRPRRCGWLDAVALRYTARLSGADSLAVALLDVLSELNEIKICTQYEIAGCRTSAFPSHVEDLQRAAPVYETLPGWRQEISHVRRFDDLPKEAQAYVQRISQLVGRPVSIVSVGPDREQTIWVTSDE